MTLPNKTKDIIVKENTYTITFPTNRQLMSIYSRKAQLSKEGYDSLNTSRDGNSKYVAMLIDAIATFENIMPPQFFKDLNVTRLGDLDVIQGAELVKVYQDQYEPFFNSVVMAIAEVLNSTKENKATEVV